MSEDLKEPPDALDAMRRHAERMEVLFEASRAFAEEVFDHARLVDLIAKTCSKLVGDFSSVTLVLDDEITLAQVAVYHPDPAIEAEYRAFAKSVTARIGEGVMGRVIEQNLAVLLPEVDPETIVARAPEAFRGVARRLNVRSLVGVPMHARGRILGGISLARSRPGIPYSDADVTFLQDVADRAALAVDNARLYGTLEKRVRAATAGLEASNKELEAFSYTVAHDLRAPLRSIDGYSKLLSDENALDPRAQDHVRHIRDSAQHMGRLIDGLLELSRITRTDLHRLAVDVSSLARGVVERLHASAPERKIELVIGEGIAAKADPTLLAVVYENLLANAWKFTSKRNPARIEVGCDRGAGPAVYFVRDNGAGFDMKYADKLFGVFERLHATHEFAGTGIGLATVERIVKRHGGRVWAEGHLDHGATFSFTLDS